MKIETGKFYKTRDGRKVGPMEVWPLGGWHSDRSQCPLNAGLWLSDGTAKHFGTKDSPDLISEWHELTPHQQRTADMIKVMQAYVDGEKVEGESDGIANKLDEPIWNWGNINYRIAPATTPDSIDWSHVAPEFKWMARDEDGTAWLFRLEPNVSDEIERWTCGENRQSVDAIASYNRGTCDWKGSLVKRP